MKVGNVLAHCQGSKHANWVCNNITSIYRGLVTVQKMYFNVVYSLSQFFIKSDYRVQSFRQSCLFQFVQGHVSPGLGAQ